MMLIHSKDFDEEPMFEMDLNDESDVVSVQSDLKVELYTCCKQYVC